MRPALTVLPRVPVWRPSAGRVSSEAPRRVTLSILRHDRLVRTARHRAFEKVLVGLLYAVLAGWGGWVVWEAVW